ncbi:MAG TPA: hypothetical protein VIA06_22895 [Candidatus Dormibacteraeota bacterium]|jgi:Flp pilus assembly protein TadB|nr:hypothetical protein [Candidatus Dormibacteraeota bacterium]
MSGVVLDPVALVAELLAILALWFLYVAFIARARPRSMRRAGSLLRMLWDRERRQSAELGWQPRWWFLLRAAALAAATAAGVWMGTPLTALLGVGLGLAGVPYLLQSRAERRRLRMDQAMVEMVRTLSSMVRGSNQTLDQALTDQGQNPDLVLASVLAPLADTQRSVRERLVEVERRMPSPIGNRICLDLVIGHSITPEAFLDAADRVLVPQYERDLQVQQRNHATAAGARQVAFICVFLMAFMFVFVMSDAALRGPYETAGGQLVLLLVVLMVAGVLWLIHLLTPRARSVRWDVRAMIDVLERRYG